MIPIGSLLSLSMQPTNENAIEFYWIPASAGTMSRDHRGQPIQRYAARLL
jgi:hypothetical protein